MPSNFRVEITGIPALKFILSRATRNTTLALASALYEEGTVIFNETQRVTPVRYGILRGSGYIDAPVITNTMVEVTLGYGGPAIPYAVYVHERVFNDRGQRIRHDPPTRSKFLEGPVLDAEPTFGNKVQRRLAGKIFTGGMT